MTTFLWVVSIFVAVLVGFFTAAIVAGSGQESRYEEGFQDGRMAEQIWLQEKIKEMKKNAGFEEVEI